MPNNNEKLIFFFSDVFRFINPEFFSSSQYRELLRDIGSIMVSSFPSKDGDELERRAFSLVCSHRTDFANHVSLIHATVDLNTIKEKYKSCP
jgi:hypothetical protein